MFEKVKTKQPVATLCTWLELSDDLLILSKVSHGLKKTNTVLTLPKRQSWRQRLLAMKASGNADVTMLLGLEVPIVVDVASEPAKI